MRAPIHFVEQKTEKKSGLFPVGHVGQHGLSSHPLYGTVARRSCKSRDNWLRMQLLKAGRAELPAAVHARGGSEKAAAVLLFGFEVIEFVGDARMVDDIRTAGGAFEAAGMRHA